MRIILLMLISATCKAQTYTTKQLSDKMKGVEATLATQNKMNTNLIADTIAKSKRIVALENDLNWFKKKIDSLTLIPDTADFMINGKELRIRRK